MYALAPGATYRAVAYFPAPAPGVEALTLDAGPFGELPDVPIA